MATTAPSTAPHPQRGATCQSRRLRGRKPLSPQSNPAEVVGSIATPPSGGFPLSGAQPPKGALPYAVIIILMIHLHTILLTHMEPIQGFDTNMISETPFQCHITGASEIIIILDLDSCACQQSPQNSAK